MKAVMDVGDGARPLHAGRGPGGGPVSGLRAQAGITGKPRGGLSQED